MIAEDSVGEVGYVHASQRVDGVSQQGRVSLGVVEIGNCGLNERRAASAEVGGDGGQLLSVAGDQEEACALRRMARTL